MVRAHILFSGTVQGIGFRYTAQGFARDLKLVGWVKNLPSGNVEILVEGAKESIEGLVENLDRYFDGYIRGKKIVYTVEEKNFSKFEIVS